MCAADFFRRYTLPKSCLSSDLTLWLVTYKMNYQELQLRSRIDCNELIDE